MEVAASECNSQFGREKSGTQLALYKQSELTMMQMARAEVATRPIMEAEKVLKEIEHDREQYLESVNWIKEHSGANSALHRLEVYNQSIKKELEEAALKQ